MAEPLSDATLLERFVNGREDAFAAIVRRHAPVVRAVCRKVLDSEHDAEDVVQATFLILAMRSGEMAWRDSVSGWLCGVARRLALHARSGRSRRGRRERAIGTIEGFGGRLPEELHPHDDLYVELTRRDLRRVIDQELNRLPDKYREPVVLCDLEGLTHAEAARQLGLPTGSMSRRLGRAREILRERLAGRGLPVAMGLMLAALLTVAWPRHDAAPPGRAAIRQAMGRFVEAGEGEPTLDQRLSLLVHPEHNRPDRDGALAVALASADVAAGLHDLDPGSDRGAWRARAGDLKDAADRLAVAARDGDVPTLLAAVRRLNDSCVRCHLAFRP